MSCCVMDLLRFETITVLFVFSVSLYRFMFELEIGLIGGEEEAIIYVGTDGCGTI